MSEERPDNRIKVVDLVRTISILAVLANHFFSVDFTPGVTVTDPVESSINAFLMRCGLSGAYGVAMFFVLSGFLITRMTAVRSSDLYQVDLRQFYIRRAGRILPLMMLILTLTATVNLTASLAPGANIPQQMALVFNPDIKHFDFTFFACLLTLSLNWLLIFGQTDYGMQLGIMWSIAVEEQFYCFLPPSLRAARNTKRFVPWLILLICFGPIARWLGNQYTPNSFSASMWNSFGAFDLISMGVILFLVERRIKPRLTEKPWVSRALCAFGMLLSVLVYFNTTTGNATDRIYGPSLLGMGVFFFLLGGLQLKWFQYLPALLILPGELSYGMYLYHPLMLFVLWPYLFGKAKLLGFLLYCLGTIVIGWFSFKFFEQPVNKLVRKRLL